MLDKIFLVDQGINLSKNTTLKSIETPAFDSKKLLKDATFKLNSDTCSAVNKIRRIMDDTKEEFNLLQKQVDSNNSIDAFNSIDQLFSSFNDEVPDIADIIENFYTAKLKDDTAFLEENKVSIINLKIIINRLAQDLSKVYKELFDSKTRYETIANIAIPIIVAYEVLRKDLDKNLSDAEKDMIIDAILRGE